MIRFIAEALLSASHRVLFSLPRTVVSEEHVGAILESGLATNSKRRFCVGMLSKHSLRLLAPVAFSLLGLSLATAQTVERKAGQREVLVEGEILDADNNKPLPARLYIQGSNGTWHFPKSAS